MNKVALKYDETSNSYTYIINSAASPNCKIYDYDLFAKVDLNRQFFLFIGCIYTGQDVGNANSLSEIARSFLRADFYFKFIFDVSEINRVVPKQVLVPKLPIIIYVKDGTISILSNGPIQKDLLRSKIELLLLGDLQNSI